MPNYAIVVGINAYRESSRFSPLSRPVGDAIRMMEWLLDPTNPSGVAEEDLILLLEPGDDEALGPIIDALPLPPPRREAIRRRLGRLAAVSNRRGAGAEEINRAVRDVHRRAGDRGERLYFYYAGHGLSAATDALGNDVEDAIVPADYDPSVPRLAFSIPSLTRTFLATSCREQFFFFDCCRSGLEREEIARIGRLTPHRGVVPTDQYIYSATALGLAALEGDCLFSDMLLKGLEGDGSAKAYSPMGGGYEVRAERLFRYLRKGFERLARGAFVGGGEGVKMQPQRPRLGGDHGGDPVLKTLAEAPAVRFRVDMEAPPGVATGAKVADVRLVGEGLRPEPPREVLAGSSASFSLAPRYYMVQVEPRPGLDAPPPSLQEVYEDPTIHPVRLTPVLAAAASPEAVRTFATSGPEAVRTFATSGPEAVRTFATSGPGTARMIATAGPDSPARLTISAEDPLAAIELLDSAGSPVPDAVGLGRLVCRDLAPGVYRARMRAPGGRTGEVVVAPGPGQHLPVRIKPDPGGRRIRRGGGLAPAGIRLVVGGEVVVASRDRLIDPELARRLSNARDVADYLDRLEVRIQPMGGEIGDADLLSRRGATAMLDRELEPGPYLLTLAEPEGRSTTFATAVLEGRTTELVVHQGADARVEVMLFMPPVDGEAPETRRAVGLLQRLVREGDARLADAAGEPLMRSSPLDPVAGMLVGLLWLRAGRLDELAEQADRMVERFPDLPDAHALLGLLRSRRCDWAGAQRAFYDSLDRGLPVLAPLLLAANDAVAALGIKCPELDEVADALIPSLLWTARRPSPIRVSP